jgi:hypothetical protein
MSNQEKFQCVAFVAADRRCILPENHEGPHDGGLKMKGTVCECNVCGKRFGSIDDFDAHAPCASK